MAPNIPESDPTLYYTLAAGLPDVAVLVFDHALRCTSAAGGQFGDDPTGQESLEGRSLLDDLFPDQRATLEPLCRQALAGAEASGRLNFRGRQQSARIVPLTTNGERGGMIILRADVAASPTEIQFRDILNSLREIVYSVALDGSTMFYVNDAVESILGYSAAEMYANPRLGFEIIHPDDVPKMNQVIESLMQGGSSEHEYRIVRPDGAVRWLHGRAHSVKDERGQVIRIDGIVADITERKQMEAALRESDLRYRIISELISHYAFSYRVDPDGQTTPEWATESFTTITGFKVDEIAPSGSFRLFHPDDRERVARDIQEVIRKGTSMSGEYRIVTRGGEIRWIMAYRVAVWDEQHKRVVRYYGVVQDITDRKMAEQQALTLALEQAKVRLMSTFMGDLWHDFSTPLSTINTSLYLLERMTDPAKHQHQIETLRKQAELIRRLVESSLMMVRLDAGMVYNYEVLSIRKVLAELKAHMADEARRRRQTLTLTVEDDLPPVRADQEMLDRALANVVENAIKYTHEGGAVDLNARRSNDSIMIDVRDDGYGIDPAYLPHIFDRLYRLPHRPEGGAGLGLSIARKIIEDHGGRIDVASIPGDGSVFTIQLPAAVDTKN